MTSVFDRAFDVVIGVEGRLSMTSSDKGNWTGGQVGVGELRGSGYGLSAALWYGKTKQWPPTLDDARGVYKPEYWDKIRGDELPPPIALVVFDARVNGGDPVRWMQTAAKVAADGVIGDVTLAAVRAASAAAIVSEINARRLVYLASLPTWSTFGLGWARRIVHLDIAATGFDAVPTVTLQTINPAPVMATLDMVRTAFREIQAERATA